MRVHESPHIPILIWCSCSTIYIHITPKQILSSDSVFAHANDEHEHETNTRFATYVPIQMCHPFVDKMRPNSICPYVHPKVVVIRSRPEVGTNLKTDRNWGTCSFMSLVPLSCDKRPMPLPFQTFPTFASLTSSVESHQRHTWTLHVDGRFDSTHVYESRRDIRSPIATSRYIAVLHVIHSYDDLCVASITKSYGVETSDLKRLYSLLCHTNVIR